MINTIIPSDGEDLEQLELLYIASGNIKLQNHFKKKFGGFLES